MRQGGPAPPVGFRCKHSEIHRWQIKQRLHSSVYSEDITLPLAFFCRVAGAASNMLSPRQLPRNGRSKHPGRTTARETLRRTSVGQRDTSMWMMRSPGADLDSQRLLPPSALRSMDDTAGLQ